MKIKILVFSIILLTFIFSCEYFAVQNEDKWNSKNIKKTMDSSVSSVASTSSSVASYPLTAANYTLVTGQDISNAGGSINTTGAFLPCPFSSGTVIYGITSDNNFVKMQIYTTVSDLSTVSGLIFVGYTLYDKNSPTTVLQNSGTFSIGSSYHLEFETFTIGISAGSDDFWFNASTNTLFELTSENGAKYFIAP